ncbi:unnamed protein product [Adineta ricciae]|uniref:G-protein coupled receptors family 1 profile domain-containing protein n=1 Tax=Adineta ricciae TaxID=249248 RepID=A0A816CJF6_ADIRI|nr:unnamed protein product [Adineta ricciae]CAF1622711.1 unnamed protein product [Adineta ricciae]
MSLTYIGQQITIYGTLCYLVTGIVGNTINVYIFSTTRSYRTNPSTFYFLINSILNLVYLLIHPTSRIAIGVGNDLTQTSTSWCKARNYVLFTFPGIVLTCPCLAMIDQFIATSRNAKLRSFSNIQLARRLMVIMCFLWALHGVPAILFYDISPATRICQITNSTFLKYRSIYLLGLTYAIPVSVTILFGYLTYRNIHSIRALVNQHIDRQILRMTIFQAVLVNVCLLPYAAIVTYNNITENEMKDTSRVLLENFLASLFVLWNYGYIVGNCYVFILSSKKFRQAVKSKVLRWRRPNQVSITA